MKLPCECALRTNNIYVPPTYSVFSASYNQPSHIAWAEVSMMEDGYEWSDLVSIYTF